MEVHIMCVVNATTRDKLNISDEVSGRGITELVHAKEVRTESNDFLIERANKILKAAAGRGDRLMIDDTVSGRLVAFLCERAPRHNLSIVVGGPSAKADPESGSKKTPTKKMVAKEKPTLFVLKNGGPATTIRQDGDKFTANAGGKVFRVSRRRDLVRKLQKLGYAAKS
jgi:hypothetical protein